MKHRSSSGYTAEDVEKGLDRLALEIQAYGSKGKGLLQMYKLLEDELVRLREQDDVMNSVLARLSRGGDRKTPTTLK